MRVRLSKELTSGSQICLRFLSVHLNDRVSEIKVRNRVLVRELAAEKLRKALHLYLVDLVDIEPSRAARNHKRMT